MKIRSQVAIYEKARDGVPEICEGLIGDDFMLTLDPGRISSETDHFDLPGRWSGAMRNLFGGSRCAEIETDALQLVEAGYVVEHDDYHVIGDRYAWFTRGKYKVMQHGAVSLLECPVPVHYVSS